MPGHEGMTDAIAALSARNAYLEARANDDRATLIEQAAIAIRTALILNPGKLSRQERAQAAVIQAVELADALDQYFEIDMQERPG